MKNKKIYKIIDCAGNNKFESKTFYNLDDAQNFLLYKFPKDEDLQEFYIVEK